MAGRLILCATEFEISPFLAQFPGMKQQRMAPGSILCSPPDAAGSGGPPSAWFCLITGPGVFNTAMGLSAFLEHHTPELILDTGFSGAYAGAGLGVGDIAVAVRERYLHTGVGTTVADLAPLPFDLIDGDPGTRSGIYRFPETLVDEWTACLRRDPACENCCIAKGDFLTVSGITRGGEAAGIYRVLSPVMEAMEGAAAAHVAQCYNLSMIEIRAASNLAGERDKSCWDFGLAADRVRHICNCFIC